MRLLLIVLLGTPVISHAKGSCGKVVSLKGQVELLRVKPDEPEVRIAEKAKRRMKFNCSDIIQTGAASRAKVRFINKSVLTMGPFSRIEVASYALKEKKVDQINLTYGKIRAYFKKVKSNKKTSKKTKGKTQEAASFRITTPTAVAGVRGTDFYIGFNPNNRVTDQATITGQVEVEDTVTKQKVVVDSGQQVKVDVAEVSKLKAGETPAMPKKLEVKPIQPKIAEEIRQTSVLVKKDKEFTTMQAVNILGAPATWTAPDVPDEFKELKEEF